MIVNQSAITITSMDGSLAVLAASSEFSEPILQFGAIGVLGVSAWYLLSRIVPNAMQQRQQESADFIRAMREMSSEHANEIKDARRDTEASINKFYTDAKEEREIWRSQIHQLNETMKETNSAIGRLAEAFRNNNGG